MIRTRSAVAGIAAALVTACCALGANESVEQSCLKAHDDAQSKAIADLQQKVLDLKVSEKKTVKDFIESTDLPKSDVRRGLLQGAVEFKPMRVRGDGECEVRVGLGGDALRANLKSILAQNYKIVGGEFANLTFDGVGGKGVEAGATGKIPAAGSGATAAQCVAGWDRDVSTDQPISTRKRIQTEHAAYLEGLAGMKAAAEKLAIGDSLTLGALMASNPLVKDTVEKFYSKLLPDQKLYWPKGIVEVRFALDYDALWTALDQANQKATDPKQKLAAEVLAAARERTKAMNAKADTFAELDGKPVNPSDVAETPAPLVLTPSIELPPPEVLAKPATTDAGMK